MSAQIVGMQGGQQQIIFTPAMIQQAAGKERMGGVCVYDKLRGKLNHVKLYRNAATTHDLSSFSFRITRRYRGYWVASV